MKKFGALIFSLVLTCAVLFSASSAFAYAEVYSNAWLGDTTISGATVGTMTYAAYADVWGVPGGNYVQVIGFPASASTDYASASGTDTNNNPLETTWAKAISDGDWAQAIAWSEVSYTLTTTATTVYANLTWNYAQTLLATMPGDYAYANSRAYYEVYYNGGWHDFGSGVTNSIDWPQTSIPDSGSENIVFERTDVIGTVYEVRAGVYNEAYASTTGGQVPVPAAIWLLGSGLIGLIGFRKKIKN